VEILSDLLCLVLHKLPELRIEQHVRWAGFPGTEGSHLVMHPEEWEKPVLNDAADTCCVSHDREKQSDESPDEHVRDRDAVQLLKKTSRPRGTLSNIADDCREGSKKRQENDGAHYTV